MNIICQHSENVTSILEKKKITKTYLSKFLHDNGISIINAWDKPSLIRKVLEFWNIQTVQNCDNDLLRNEQQYNKVSNNYIITVLCKIIV